MIALAMMLAAVPSQKDIVSPALKVARVNYERQKDDKFAAQADIPIADGQEFVVRFKFLPGDRRGVNSGGSTLWTYDDGILKLSIYPDTNFVKTEEKNSIGHQKERAISVIYYSVTNAKIGSFTGQNSFGVRMPVTQHVTYEYGIGIASMPKGETTSQDHIDFMKKAGASDAELAGYYNEFFIEIPVPGAEAKRLTSDAYAEIEGSISSVFKRTTNCQSRFSGAEVNHPWELTTYSCWAGANIKRVTFIDGASGKILKEWRK